MLGTSDAWSTSHSSQHPSEPAYYIVDCRISIIIGQIFLKMHFCCDLVMVVAYLCLSVLSRLLLSSARLLWLRKNITNMFMEHLSTNQISFYPLFSDYGNTGCGVFKRGKQNQKDFCIKVNIPKGKLLNFENWTNGEPQ